METRSSTADLSGPTGSKTAESRLQAVLRRDSLDASTPPLAAAYLFGSEARGSARAGSDLDIAVLWQKEPDPGLSGPVSELQGQLEKALRRPVDLINLHRAPADLVHRILRDSRLLYDDESGRRTRYEVRRRQEYFDLLPYLRRYRRFSP